MPSTKPGRYELLIDGKNLTKQWEGVEVRMQYDGMPTFPDKDGKVTFRPGLLYRTVIVTLRSLWTGELQEHHVVVIKRNRRIMFKAECSCERISETAPGKSVIVFQEVTRSGRRVKKERK